MIDDIWWQKVSNDQIKLRPSEVGSGLAVLDQTIHLFAPLNVQFIKTKHRECKEETQKEFKESSKNVPNTF